MSSFKVVYLCAALCIATAALGQGRENKIYKGTVVALTQDPALRADFERQFVGKAREHNYDVVRNPKVHVQIDEPIAERERVSRGTNPKRDALGHDSSRRHGHDHGRRK